MIIAIKYNPSAILVRRHITLRGKAIIHITSLLKSIYFTLTCMYKNLGEINQSGFTNTKVVFYLYWTHHPINRRQNLSVLSISLKPKESLRTISQTMPPKFQKL